MDRRVIRPEEESSIDGGAITLVDIGRAQPARRRPYFLEQPDLASSPSVTQGEGYRIPPVSIASPAPLRRPTEDRSVRVIDLRELGPQRDTSTLLRALAQFAISLALMCSCGIMAAVVTSGRVAAACFAATLIAGAGALLAAEVLAEELEFFLITRGATFIRARFWWERMRRRIRALAGGTTALSFGPYR